MPFGPAPLGFVYFAGVKFAGYTGAAAVLKRTVYPRAAAGVAKIGVVRTAIGLGAGLVYGGLWFLAVSFFSGFRGSGELASLGYLLGLLPIRILEWTWLLDLFFDPRLKDRARSVKSVIGGTVWSYCLDAVGIIAAFVIPGGAWIC